MMGEEQQQDEVAQRHTPRDTTDQQGREQLVPAQQLEKKLLPYRGTWSVGDSAVHVVQGRDHAPRRRIVTLSVAPMMKWTNRHYRCMARLLSSRAVLYTEMCVASTIIHNSQSLEWSPERERFPWCGQTHRCTENNKNTSVGEPQKQKRLRNDGVVLQLGGNCPDQLKRAATIAVQEYGYAELNLNVGCPSDRVAGKGMK